MPSTVTLRVDGLTCALCIGDILERIHAVPGVEQVKVGPVEQGRSWVTVTSERGASLTRLSRALSAGGFHISGAGARATKPGNHEIRRTS